jgi:hypothetical protein
VNRIIPYQLEEGDMSCANCGDGFDLNGAFYDNDTFLVICFDCACQIDPDLEWRMRG